MPTISDDDDGREDLPEPLLDIAAVARLLGVSIRHVRRLVLEGRIPYIKWGALHPLRRCGAGPVDRRVPEVARPDGLTVTASS
jgi:excisionase family DNA binding protein